MFEINVKDARSQFSALLDKVKKGETIIITRRGEQVAQLIAAKKPRKKNKKFPSLEKLRASIKMKGAPMSRTVMQMREEERY